jgi:nitrous oxidase accessory protein NosD
MKRAMAGMVAVGVLAAAALFGVANPASAATRIVKAGESIQAAIDASSPGDTIILKAGATYNENLTITTDKLTIIGNGALLKPPATPGAPNNCDLLFADDPATATAVTGVCIAGVVDEETFEVTDPVKKTRIQNLRVDGFDGSGIFEFGGKNTTFLQNTTTNNAGYGIFSLSSPGAQVIGNRTSGSGDAGIYIGGSPDADATVTGNRSFNNFMGLFIRDAHNIDARSNQFTGNCIGVFVLADAPGPAGDVRLSANIIKNNSKFCAAPPDEGGNLGGIGVGLSGAHDVHIVGNIITNNTAPAGVAEHGGVVVFTGDGGTTPTNNVVKGNVIKGNNPDIVWDGAGTGNVFKSNAGCTVSVPADLC